MIRARVMNTTSTCENYNSEHTTFTYKDLISKHIKSRKS